MSDPTSPAPESHSRHVFKNTFYLYGSEAFARLFTWGLIVYLTRTWPVKVYGRYALVVNWVTIFGVVSEVGLNALTVREVAKNSDLAGFYLRNVFVIRSALSLVFLAVMVSIAFLLGYETVIKIGLLVLGLRIVLDSMAGGYVYLLQSHQQMGLYSLSTFLSGLIRFIGIILIVYYGGSVVEASWGWVIASAAALVFLVWVSRKRGWKPRFPEFKMSEALGILKLSLPLASFGALQMLYYRVDSVILKSLSGNEAVAYYDLAIKILFMILLIPQLYTTALYPVFSSAQQEPEVFGRLVVQSIKFLVLLGLPVMVGGFFLAKPLMTLVSGPRYETSGPLFALLMFSVVPFFISNVYAGVLAIKNTFRLNLHYLFLSVLNIALNFILIPYFGSKGAAEANVICGIFGLGLGFWFVHPYVRHANWPVLTRPVVASVMSSLLMGAGVWWQPKLYWLLLGPLVYGMGLLLFRAFDADDWIKIRSILKMGNPS